MPEGLAYQRQMLADVWLSDPYAVPFGRCAMGLDRLVLSFERVRLGLTPLSGMLVVGPMARAVVPLPTLQENVDSK